AGDGRRHRSPCAGKSPGGPESRRRRAVDAVPGPDGDQSCPAAARCLALRRSQGRPSCSALSARRARHCVPCGLVPGDAAAHRTRDDEGRRGAETRRGDRGARMSNEAIGYLGMLALTLLILLRVPVAVALGLVGFFGYCALEGWN